MKQCDFCNASVESLIKTKDGFGNDYEICGVCKGLIDNKRCINCGKALTINLRGTCENCYQVYATEKQRRIEEVQSGVINTTLELSAEEDFTDEEYERWMTSGKTFSPSDLKKSIELRRLWIIIKLKLAGIKDNQLINDNIENLEILLERSFTKIVGNKCRLALAKTAKDMHRLNEQYEIIDFEGNAYIIKA